MKAIGPALARQRLSTRLREMRGDRPAADAAKAMHWSLSKLNRIENNKVTIQPLEVRALAHYYGLTDPDEVEQLVQMASASRRRMWWRELPFAEEEVGFIAFENDASHLYAYQAAFVPSLLQTQPYAEALVSSRLRQPPDAPDVSALVDVQMRRQKNLLERLDGERPPLVSHVIDESVLLRPVSNDAVMTEQIGHLREMARHPAVRILVMPFARGAHAGLNGSFDLLTFADDADLAVVFVATQGRNFLITEAEETAEYRKAMEELLAGSVELPEVLALRTGGL